MRSQIITFYQILSIFLTSNTTALKTKGWLAAYNLLTINKSHILSKEMNSFLLGIDHYYFSQNKMTASAKFV